MSKKKPIIGRSITLTPEQWAEVLKNLERDQARSTVIRSTAFANVIDLVSEGEIEGIQGGAKGVYLDETPIQNPDGSYNFSGVLLDSRNGTQGQTYIPGFSEVQDDVVVQVKATFSSPVTRQITNTNVDAVVVKITTPQLTLTNTTTGEIGGNDVQYKIQLQSNGGGYVDVVDSELIGKSTSRYQKSHRIELTGDPPWDIRLRRTKADAVSVYDQNEIYFDSYTEIIDTKLRYPNSAIVSLKVDAAKFNNIPRRAFHLKGLKIKIPDNATVRADGSLSYSGSWSGNFTTAYCNNPAWCFYDLLTSERYGLGAFIAESHIDKWSLYSIGQFCDELVDNGLGGTEPRFSCNIYLQSQEQAYKVIQDFASIFRSMAYWANGSIVTVQDAPSDPVYLYTQANVIDGNFNYQGASKRAKHTVALVTWNDPEDFYRQKVEYVEDQAAIAKVGVIKTQIIAVGCTSRGQANRVGKWLLYSEQNESEVINFRTGIEGAVARPGQIINVADSNRSGRRMAGRISTATTSMITVDGDLEANYVGGSISVLLPSGSVETKIIATQNGRVLTLTSALSVAPNPQSIWMISTAEVSVQTFRLISVVQNKSGEIEITGVKHDSRKYDAVEDGTQLSPRSYTTFSATPATPQDIIATENLYDSVFGIKTKVTISWTQIPGVVSYAVKYKKDNFNYSAALTTPINEIELHDITPGNYTFLVYAVNPIGKQSLPGSLIQTIYGKTAPPADVQNFSMFPNSNIALLSWTKATDLDVLVGGTVRIRHTPRTTGATWASSVDIIDFVPGSDTTAFAPLLAGTYLAKFVDSSGNESVTEALALTTTPLPAGLNVVDTQTETGVWGGAKSNTEYNPDLGLTLSTAALFDDLGPIDDLSNVDWNGDVVASGEYQFLNTPDLGQVFTSNLTSMIKTLAFDTGTYFDDHTDLIDDWIDIDGADVAAVNAKLYVRTTEDDTLATPTWTEWKPFFTGSYKARGFQFKLILTSTVVTANIAIQECSVTIDMPDRTEEHAAIVSGVGTYTLTYDYEFNAVPAVGIIAHNMVSGDYYTVSNKTTTNFDIIFKNASNTTISRTFDAVIKGYGLKT